MNTTTIVLLIVLGVMVVLYTMKRRARLNKEDVD
jgi:heme/copper-type cytochrome/quinol oxidase subunit 2